jgi:arylsulfatase A-like enzyme
MPCRALTAFSLTLLSGLGCHRESGALGPTDVDPPTGSRRNVLLIIADDMGKDATSGFSEGSIKPQTPQLDQLAASGLTFTNLWVNPTCSPTRATMITGRYGFRTGVTRSGRSLPTSETTLQSYIGLETGNAYATAVVGKWHLSQSSTFDPEILGIDYYAGVLGAGPESYYEWSLTEDGVSTTETGYNTEVLTDLAIDWVRDQAGAWFLWLAYNAPHTPFHVPPEDMHTQGALPHFRPGMDATPYYMAAIEAMDSEIGRLLDSLTLEERANTTVIFVGDNGTPNQVVQAPFTPGTAKGSVYEGGINTPMFVTGSGVVRTGTDDNLINGTDLFATIAALAGSSVTEVNDSRSFLPLLGSVGTHREFLFSEIDDDAGVRWALRDQRYKLIVNEHGDEQMFDLLADPYEGSDLIDIGLDASQSQAKAELLAWMETTRG